MRTERETELQCEIERLKAWLYKIQNMAYQEQDIAKIEGAARESLIHSNCATQSDWGGKEEWPILGKWPPKEGATTDA